MLFRTILTPIALLGGLVLGMATAGHAESKPTAKSSRDETIVDMSQAFKQGDRKRLSALLPQARGHVLEPWAAYWELKARLETASATEVQAFLTRYAGSYQEDRLRNDWLLLLGRSTWPGWPRRRPGVRPRWSPAPAGPR